MGLPLDANSVAGIAGLTAAALLVPARYLLLEKLTEADASVIDPRLVIEVEKQIEALPLPALARRTLATNAIQMHANRNYNSMLELLEADFANPSRVPDVTSWPPRVGTAIAWMHVGDHPPLESTDLADICARSAYLDKLIQGRGRDIALVEQKAVWPWT